MSRSADGLWGGYLLALQRDKPETPDGVSWKFSVMETTLGNLLLRGVQLLPAQRQVSAFQVAGIIVLHSVCCFFI